MFYLLDFNIEIIEEIFNKLDISKSPGMDSLSPSHFKNCHPIVLLTLTKLFKLMLTFNYVPNDFGMGITIPIPKNSNKTPLTNADKVQRHNDKPNYLEEFLNISV